MKGDNENTGHVNIDVENIEMSKVNNTKSDDSFKKLKNLISKSKTEFEDSAIQIQQIRELLVTNAETIFTTHPNGQNIFHILATQPDRNGDILSVFGLDGEGNSENVRKLVSHEQLDKLLHMPKGPRKSLPIHLAVSNGFVEYLKAMLEMSPNLISARDGEDNTVLHLAAISSMPEAAECMKTVILVMEKNQLEAEIFKATNCKGHTPVHSLCSKVPANADARVITKLRCMMKYDFSQDILKSLDHTQRTPLHLLCSKDEQGKDADRKNSNLQALFENLIENGSDIVNQHTNDEHRRTPLHLLVISEYANLIKTLVALSQCTTNVTLKDAHGKMAIHYAAENALQHRSQECVKILANWELIKTQMSDSNEESLIDQFRRYILWESFKEKDGTEWTVLTLACKSKSTKTVEYLLKNVYDAKKNFGIWFAGAGDKDRKQEVFSLKQVYKHTPEALEFLFDKSISISLDKSNENRVEFVTDLSIVTALGKPIQDDAAMSEMKYLSYADKWPEEIQEKLLLHPLAQCAIHAIWNKMLLYKILWLIWNIVWLVAYWILVPLDYSHTDKRFPVMEVIAAWILGVQSLFYVANELLTFKNCLKRLFTVECHAKLTWIQILLTLYCVHGPCLQSVGAITESPPNNLEKSCAAAGVLLSFIIFWRNMGLIYLTLGVYVEYIIQTLKKIVQAFICTAAVIIGFQRAFSQILPQHFSSAVWAFTKTLVMLTGEFDFGEMYEMYKSGNDNDTTIADNETFADLIDFGTWNLVVFILFLILLPITFYNLVTGVVVDKIRNMEMKLEMYQIRNQIRLINYMQRTIVAKLELFEHWFKFLQNFFISYRKTDTGEIILDQEVNWFVEKHTDTSFCSILCHTFKVCRNCDRNGDENISCGNLLSKSLRSKIYELYENDLKEYEKYD